ncbi:MAG TPA: protein kinase family protein [Cellulomonas sp.]
MEDRPGDDARRDAAPVGRLGATIAGRYRLDEPLPADLPGAERWAGRDQILARDVSITLVTGARTGAVVDAARRAALVIDPRLARILDVGTTDGTGYVVTEAVEGRTLAALTARAPLPADQARAVVGEAAAALEVARRRGVHHLALRPAALRVTSAGRVVLDGLAVDGELLGGTSGGAHATSRSDTVGLVRLLYAALTGRWPVAPGAEQSTATAPTFDEWAAQTAIAPATTTDGPAFDPGLPIAPDADGTPVPPGDLVPAVPADLDTLCSVTLGPHDDGPHSPGELVRELEPWRAVRADAIYQAADAGRWPAMGGDGGGQRATAGSVPWGPAAGVGATAAGGGHGAAAAAGAAATGAAAAGSDAALAAADAIGGAATGAAGAAAAPERPAPSVPVRRPVVGRTPASGEPNPEPEPAEAVASTQALSAARVTAPAVGSAEPPVGTAPTPITAPARPGEPASTAPTPAASPAAAAAPEGPAAPSASAGSSSIDAPTRGARPPDEPPADQAGTETTSAPPTGSSPMTDPRTPTPDDESVDRPDGASTPTEATPGVARQSVRSAFHDDDRPGTRRPGTPPPATPAPASFPPAASPTSAPVRTSTRATAAVPPTVPPATAPGAPVPPAAAAVPPAVPPAARRTTAPAAAAPSTAGQAAAAPAPAGSGTGGGEPPAWDLPFAAQPARRPATQRRFDPTRWVLGVVALAVVVGVVVALSNVLAPWSSSSDVTAATTAPVTAEPAPTDAAADPGAADGGDAAAAVPPQVAAVNSVDPSDGDGEHEELVGALTDGDPATAWYTHTYNRPDFAGFKDGVGLVVTLAAPATVTSITLDVNGSGGNVEVRSTDGANPTTGDILVSGPLDGQTVLTLVQPTQTQSIVLWFTALSQTSDGKNRIEITNLAVS